MVGFQHFQFRHLHIQVHLFLDERISGAQCLDLRIRQSLLVYIITGTHRGFGGHNLRDESLLVLQGLKQVAVKSSFCDIVEHLDFLVHVALPDNAAIALCHVAGLPADIQVMHRHKPLLDVRSGSHFCCTSEQNPNIAGTHFGEQRSLFRFGICRMDKLNLAFRHPGGDQFPPNIIVDIEVVIVFRCREVAE